MAANGGERMLRIIVVSVIFGLWALGVVLAAVDGSTVLRATTPLVTLVFGWLFAARATTPPG